MADDNSTVPSQRNGCSHGHSHHHRRLKNKQPALVDSVSSLPDEILQNILCSFPTKFVIRTSVLSKRWRHVWCATPSLSFEHSPPKHIMKPPYTNETLNRYTALKMMSFHFYASDSSIDYIDSWIEFVMSRNVETLSIDIWLNKLVEFEFPDFFYNNSSLKQLTVELLSPHMNPKGSVSWTSLKKLSLRWCKLPDESIAKILSGCPILEILTLHCCKELSSLDLSNNPNLTTLLVRYSSAVARGPTQIVAPHIHSLKLMKSLLPCTLLDVSSLTEAILDISYNHVNEEFDAYFLHFKMLEKLKNVEKLTLGETFLQILSLAEICGVPFPMFKVKALTLKTSISQYVIPGIERMLQNSPDLKIITLHMRICNNTIPVEDLDTYVRNLTNPDQSWRSKTGVLWNKDRLNVKLNHVVSFMELMLEKAEALEKLVVRFQDSYRKFKEPVPILSNKHSVSIVLSTKLTKIGEILKP